jgi:DNA-directed RNA polymerase subunit RPC12/RpoP
MESMEHADDKAAFVCSECEEIFLAPDDETAECPTCGERCERWV